jgi:hypothetical protein
MPIHVDVFEQLDERAKKRENETNRDIYQSQDGFIEANVLRGFTEIENLFNFIYTISGQHKYFICGGWVRYMCSNHSNPIPGCDVDIYCMDEKAFDDLQNAFNLNDKHTLSIKHENAISITYSKPKNRDHPFFASPIIQLIKPTKEGRLVSEGTMEDILENFDFTVVRCGLKSPKKAVVDADFFHDEEKRIVRIKNIHCPIGTNFRCIKYSKKGYWLPTAQCFRLFQDWDERNSDYKEKMKTFFTKAEASTLTQEEIDHQEALMRID